MYAAQTCVSLHSSLMSIDFYNNEVHKLPRLISLAGTTQNPYDRTFIINYESSRVSLRIQWTQFLSAKRSDSKSRNVWGVLDIFGPHLDKMANLVLVSHA